MDIDSLKKIRKEAEAAVSDMPTGELRIKAFEIILQQLLAKGGAVSVIEHSPQHKSKRKSGSGGQSRTHGPKAQITRLLKEEKFFSQPRSLQDVQKKLQEHGFRYPVTTTGVVLMRMTQQRLLRRNKEGKGKKGYAYTNW